MSRYCGEHDVKPILDAAQHWKNECLLKNLSVFNQEILWSSKHIAALDKYFVNNLDLGEGDFFEKLEAQLKPVDKGTKQLAAEMLWVMLLCPSNIGSAKKRESIERIWSWSGETLESNHSLLVNSILNGVGSSGTSFNTNL